MVDFDPLAVENPDFVFENAVSDGGEAVVEVGTGGEDVGEVDGGVEKREGLGEGIGTQVVGNDEGDDDGVGLGVGVIDEA